MPRSTLSNEKWRRNRLAHLVGERGEVFDAAHDLRIRQSAVRQLDTNFCRLGDDVKIRYQVALRIDDNGRSKGGLHAKSRSFVASRRILHEPFGIDIGNGWRADFDGIRVARGSPGAATTNGRQQIWPDKHHEERDRETDDDRLHDEQRC